MPARKAIHRFHAETEINLVIETLWTGGVRGGSLQCVALNGCQLGPALSKFRPQ